MSLFLLKVSGRCCQATAHIVRTLLRMYEQLSLGDKHWALKWFGVLKIDVLFAPETLKDVSSPSLLSTLRSQATWTSPWWTFPSCSARSPSWRAWCSTATAYTTEWLRRSPWDSSSGTCKCEHTHTHRGVTRSDERRGRLPVDQENSKTNSALINSICNSKCLSDWLTNTKSSFIVRSAYRADFATVKISQFDLILV